MTGLAIVRSIRLLITMLKYWKQRNKEFMIIYHYFKRKKCTYGEK